MRHLSTSPIDAVLDRQRFVVLDGGLATELEARGCDLSDELWSARILMDDPGLIRDVHLDYLRAGADCVLSASYQATVPGFVRRGLARDRAEELIRLSVQLAKEACEEFWRDPANRDDRVPPLVAASVGPYGAYLADGSEYTGSYDIGEPELYDFHRDRWRLLRDSGADLMACETVPSLDEVRALSLLLRESPDVAAWMSFSCGDAAHLRDGSPLHLAVSEVAELRQVTAVGVNCVAPSIVPGLIQQVRALTGKTIVVYPNSGERWDARRKSWVGVGGNTDIGESATQWFDLGARVIGGCCRTGPADIRSIRRALVRHVS